MPTIQSGGGVINTDRPGCPRYSEVSLCAACSQVGLQHAVSSPPAAERLRLRYACDTLNLWGSRPGAAAPHVLIGVG